MDSDKQMPLMVVDSSSASVSMDEGVGEKMEEEAVAAGFDALSDDVASGFQFVLDQTSDAFGRSTTKGRTERFNEPMEYGADYAVMSLDLLSHKQRMSPTTAALFNEYLEALYTPSMAVEALRTTRAEAKSRLMQGSKYEAPTGKRSWTLLRSKEDLFRLSTFTVQSYMCAALNCRRLLRFVFGVSTYGMIDGITLTMVDRDQLRQGIDFAMSREFIPPIDPDIYSVDFLPVMDKSDNTVLIENCFVVEITLKRVSSQVYQLSSGRVFFQDVEDSSKVKEADSLMQVRDFIAARCQASHMNKLARLEAQLNLAKRSTYTLLLYKFSLHLAIQMFANAFLF